MKKKAVYVKKEKIVKGLGEKLKEKVVDAEEKKKQTAAEAARLRAEIEAERKAVKDAE